MRIIDISLPLRNGMVVWPGDEPFARKIDSAIARGDSCNLSRMSVGLHNGTHMDAPLHFVDGAAAIDTIDLSVFVGPCRVVAVEPDAGPECPAHQIQAETLRALDLAGVERLLFKTANSALYDRPEFDVNFIGLSVEAARYLAGLESLRLVGIDYYSIGPYGDLYSAPVHQALLERGIAALEGIDLRQVEPGEYELVALPLRIEGAEASPVRAVLIQR